MSRSDAGNDDSSEMGRDRRIDDVKIGFDF
jgi:hypothetical protein